MKKLLSLILIALVASPAVCLATSQWNDPDASYEQKMGKKLDFGIRNALGGWTELFVKPKNGESAMQQAYNAVACTAGGLLHIATFPATNLDIQLPNDGAQVSKDNKA